MSCFPCTGSCHRPAGHSRAQPPFQLPLSTHQNAPPGRLGPVQAVRPRPPVAGGREGVLALTSPPPVDFAHFELTLQFLCPCAIGMRPQCPQVTSWPRCLYFCFLPFLDLSFNSSRAPWPPCSEQAERVRCDSNTESSL